MPNSECSFNLIGPIRIIAAKWEKNTNDKWDKPYQLLHAEIFENGLICRGEKGYYPRYNWSEEVETFDLVETMLFDKPVGLYEIVGSLYFHSWRSYEGEYDADAEIRDEVIQEITFNDAQCFDDDEYFKEERVQLTRFEWSGSEQFDSDTSIHWLMRTRQIFEHQANALENLCNRYYMSSNRQNKDKMSDDDLENYIHSLMLYIDSEESTDDHAKDRSEKSKKIDIQVQKVLEQQRNLMGEEYGRREWIKKRGLKLK